MSLKSELCDQLVGAVLAGETHAAEELFDFLLEGQEATALSIIFSRVKERLEELNARYLDVCRDVETYYSRFSNLDALDRELEEIDSEIDREHRVFDAVGRLLAYCGCCLGCCFEQDRLGEIRKCPRCVRGRIDPCDGVVEVRR